MQYTQGQNVSLKHGVSHDKHQTKWQRTWKNMSNECKTDIRKIQKAKNTHFYIAKKYHDTQH